MKRVAGMPLGRAEGTIRSGQHQLTAGSEDAADLVDECPGVGDVLDRLEAHHQLERLVFEWQLRSICAYQPVVLRLSASVAHADERRCIVVDAQRAGAGLFEQLESKPGAGGDIQHTLASCSQPGGETVAAAVFAPQLGGWI